MSLNISSRNFELTPAIHSYLEEKIASLTKYHVDIIGVDVEVDKNMHHRQGEVFHVRMNVNVPQQVMHVEATTDDLYAAIDKCRDSVDAQMRDRKEKFDARKRKAQRVRRALKSIFGLRER